MNILQTMILPHFLRAACSKLEEITSLIGFIEEISTQVFEEKQENQHLALAALREQLQDRLQQMTKERKVHVFLLPNIPLSAGYQEEKQKFPLQLMKLLPKTLPVTKWPKIIRQYEEQYTNSIYQKLFEALLLFHRHLGELLDHKEGELHKDSSRQRLEQLRKNFQFRLQDLQHIQATMGIVLECSEVYVATQKQQRFPLEEFKKAWSYFLSSILITRYYQAYTPSPGAKQRFNTEKYMAAIHKFVRKQMQRKVNHFSLDLSLLNALSK